MTARSRYVLRYTGPGAAPQEHVQRLRNVPGAKVVAQADNMLLVDGSRAALEQAVRSLDHWVLAEDKTIPVPDTRKKIRRAPR